MSLSDGWSRRDNGDQCSVWVDYSLGSVGGSDGAARRNLRRSLPEVVPDDFVIVRSCLGIRGLDIAWLVGAGEGVDRGKQTDSHMQDQEDQERGSLAPTTICVEYSGHRGR